MPITFGKWNRGQQNPRAKLARAEVRWLRTWAQREGFGVPLMAQVAVGQSWYPQVTRRTIRAILENNAWYDPAYRRDERLRDGVTPLSWADTLWLWLCLLVLLGAMRGR